MPAGQRLWPRRVFGKLVITIDQGILEDAVTVVSVQGYGFRLILHQRAKVAGVMSEIARVKKRAVEFFGCTSVSHGNPHGVLIEVVQVQKGSCAHSLTLQVTARVTCQF